MRWWKRLLAGLAALLVLGLAGGTWLVWRNLPSTTDAGIPGLGDPVRVDLDDHGVPTLHAATLLDAYRAQGFVTARERLFQMEVMRRSADGRLAEAFGPAALPLDRLHRIYGFRQVAEAAYARSGVEARRGLEAYAAGVNAFLTERAGRLGLEFQLLGLRPEPWRPEDGLKVLLLMHEDLSTSWKLDLQAEALAALPEATRRFLLPSLTEDDRPLVPDARPQPPDTVAFLTAAATPKAAQDPRLGAWLRAAAALPTPVGESALASNNWVVAGSRTRSGKPLLANDPHLDLACPGIWFPLRLQWGGRWAQGVALPGLPTLVIGHNERIAWGFTNLGTDLQDLYREAPVARRLERIAVKGQQPVDLTVALGRHGPQVAPGLSLCWPALDPATLQVSLDGLLEARDWAAFNAAIDRHPGPPQNMVYADVDGHIGWRASGLVPLRAPGDDGSRVHDGTDPAQDWRGFVPAQAMPRVLDPPEGFLATANDRTIGTAFPHPVATAWAGLSRASRIRERLAAEGPWDAAGLEALQRDPVSRFHRAFIEALGPVAGLPGFTGSADPDSVTFTRAELLRRVFRKRLLARLLEGTGLAPADYRWYGEDAWLLAAARAEEGPWKAAGLGSRAAFLAGCLEEARRHPDWNRTWGAVNALRMKHPFGRGGGVLGWLFNPAALRVPGSAKSIRVLTGTHGQSMRMVVDLADLAATRLVLPLGASGHLGSAHREDQAPLWAAGDPVGDRTRLARPPKAGFTLRPAPVPGRT